MGSKFTRQQKRLALVDIPIKNPPRKGEITAARVVRVYDGDTWDVIYEITKNVPFQISIRAMGIDTPEIKTKNKLEKRAAIKIRNRLREALEGKTVPLKIYDWDKYGGRVIGEIYYKITYHTLSPDTLNQRLIDGGWARYYDGRTKKLPWRKSELLHILATELKLD